MIGRFVRSGAASMLALPYRFRFGRLGRRARVFPPVLLSAPARISIGDSVWIEALVTLSAGNGGQIEIGSNCELRSFARLEADEGKIQLGDRCSVNPFTLLSGYGGLRIGSNVRIASHCVILSSTHNYDDPEASIISQGVSPRATEIEDDVWIGSHAVVAGGVRVGKHSIIGAGAIVLADVPPYSVAAGVPARVLRSRTS